MSLTLGIDIGTSGVRTAIIDGDTPISMARAEHLPQTPDRIDAAKWWTAVETCLEKQIKALAEEGRSAHEIKRIAIDGTSGSMVLTDAALNPVSPALMYNSKGFDPEAARIDAIVEGTHITKGANSALARAMRLVSLAEGEPAHLLHQADYIAAKLMGVGGHSDYNNALKTGFDPETGRWPDWTHQVIDTGLLPQVHAPGAAFGPVSAAMAQRLGLSPETMVHAGTTDSIAAFLAAAPLAEGTAVTSLGSTLAIKLISTARIDDPASGLYSHRLGEFWLVGGASNTGGAVLAAHFSTEALVALTQQIDLSTPSGLDYYPLTKPGERFPINDPNLEPRLTPRPANDATFLYGMLESMARIEAECYARITAQGGSAPMVVHTAGGGAKNPVWTELRARALGCALLPAAHEEAAIGVARLAAQAQA